MQTTHYKCSCGGQITKSLPYDGGEAINYPGERKRWGLTTACTNHPESCNSYEHNVFETYEEALKVANATTRLWMLETKVKRAQEKLNKAVRSLSKYQTKLENHQHAVRHVVKPKRAILAGRTTYPTTFPWADK